METPRLTVASFLCASVFTNGIAAQAPVITPDGDPSVDADTIYALATDPADRPQDAVVYLLDDAVMRLEADGSGTRTYRQVVHILREQAVRGLAERRLRYSPDHQNLTLNWVRVLRPTGEIVSDGPAQMQQTDVAASTSNPVYVEQKELRFSLGGVTANTIIDMSYTVEETKPYLQGDFLTQWNVHSTVAPVLRSRLILDVPTGIEPVITEENLDFAGQKFEGGGRSAYTWATSDVPRYRAEPFSPDTNSVHMHVIASLPMTWSAIGRWYHGLSRDRYELSDDLRARIAEIVAPATSRLDTLHAVHRWVAQDIRYVSVSLGIGGYQPRMPGETVTTGFGDCKDKATLFIAAARMLGYEAYPVLLHQNGGAVRPQHPSIRQFNHMIAAVRESDGYTFTDLTARLTPYGEVPAPSRGGHAVVVLADGQVEEVTLPAIAPGDRRIDYRIVATLSDSGQLSGYMEETNRGPAFESRRNLFSQPLDSARAATVMQALLRILPGAVGDSIRGFDGTDLDAPVNYQVWFADARGISRTGGLALFTFPFGVLPATNRIRAIEAAGERTTSINAVEVLRSPPPTWLAVDMEVTLPEGWHVRIPDDVIVESDFGMYSTEYSQAGRVLRIRRTERSAIGVYPPDRIADVIAFFRAISADEDNRQLIIEESR